MLQTRRFGKNLVREMVVLVDEKIDSQASLPALFHKKIQLLYCTVSLRVLQTRRFGKNLVREMVVLVDEKIDSQASLPALFHKKIQLLYCTV